jgi:hypothetical protein
MPMLPPFPKSYKVETVRSDGRGRTMIYVDGDKKRFEDFTKAGQTEIVIFRRDLNVRWELYPDAKTYFQSKFDPRKSVVNPDTFYDWNEDGFEIINGRRCLSDRLKIQNG